MCCTPYASKFGKLSSGHRTGKTSFHSNPKECLNYHTIACILQASKVMIRFLQASLQQDMNQELADVQAGFRKGRWARDQIANICWIIEKQETSRKKIYFCFIDYTKALTLWITTNCGILFHWEYQTTLPVSCETCMQVKKQQLELDMEQWTVSKLGKEYIKAVYCHPAYLTSIQSTSCEMPGWINHKLVSKLPEEISTTSDMQMIPL